MAPEASRFNSFLRILENAISSKQKKTNKQTKKQTNEKATRACFKVYLKTHEIHGTKVPWPATKEDKCCFFMIAKPLSESLADR